MPSPVRVVLTSPTTVAMEGTMLRLRVRHQGLLLAALMQRMPEEKANRAEIALQIWPDAPPANAKSYLRRALMELRQSGLPIESDSAEIWINPDNLDLIAGDLSILDQFAHPLAEEAKARIQGHVVQIKDEAYRPDNDVLNWFFDQLIANEPQSALAVLSQQGYRDSDQLSPEGFLSLLLRAIKASPELTSDRAQAKLLAAEAAHNLTRHHLSRRLNHEVIEECRALDMPKIECLAWKGLYSTAMAHREFDAAKTYADEAMRAAEGAEIRGLYHLVYQAYGSLAWHQNDQETAYKYLAKSFEHSVNPNQVLVSTGNLAILWALNDVDVDPKYLTSLPDVRQSAYMGAAESVAIFNYGVGHKLPVEAVFGARRLLEISGKEGMEHLACLAFDYATIAFAMLDAPEQSAACLRLGTRLRRTIGQWRTEGEKPPLRKFGRGRYFAPAVARQLREWMHPDPEVLAARISGDLRDLTP